jgi:hypothetical protein
VHLAIGFQRLVGYRLSQLVLIMIANTSPPPLFILIPAWAKENEPEIYKALKAAGMAPDSDSDSEEEGEGESGEEQG